MLMKLSYLSLFLRCRGRRRACRPDHTHIGNRARASSPASSSMWWCWWRCSSSFSHRLFFILFFVIICARGHRRKKATRKEQENEKQCVRWTKITCIELNNNKRDRMRREMQNKQMKRENEAEETNSSTHVCIVHRYSHCLTIHAAAAFAHSYNFSRRRTWMRARKEEMCTRFGR